MTDEVFRAKLQRWLDENVDAAAAITIITRIAIGLRQNWKEPTDQTDHVLEVLADYGLDPIADLEEREYEEGS